MKTFLLLMIFGFSKIVMANDICQVVEVKAKEIKLEKIYVKFLEKGKTKVRFLFNKELVKANSFFCYQRTGFKECLGDDDSGKFLVKKDGLIIHRLTIRTSDDNHHKVKKSKVVFPMTQIDCSNFP